MLDQLNNYDSIFPSALYCSYCDIDPQIRIDLVAEQYAGIAQYQQQVETLRFHISKYINDVFRRNDIAFELTEDKADLTLLLCVEGNEKEDYISLDNPSSVLPVNNNHRYDNFHYKIPYRKNQICIFPSKIPHIFYTENKHQTLEFNIKLKDETWTSS